jgi:L-ascorbate metabolism protein UlaG (beta-lactamase superfamily)
MIRTAPGEAAYGEEVVKAMRITKYIHACLLIEDGPSKILFDPGKFSFIEGHVDPNIFRDLSAVVITHQHPDHIDDEALTRIMANNPSARLITNAEVRDRVEKAGLTAELLEDGTLNVAGFDLKAVHAKHANLLNSEPPVNVAYIVNNLLLNPGDSFDHTLDEYKGIPVLALPTMAPWNTELEVASFATRLSPRRVIPIHDGYAKEFFLKLRYENYSNYFAGVGIKFEPLLNPGDAIEV